MSVKRWTRTHLLEDGGVLTGFCVGNSTSVAEIQMVINLGARKPKFYGRFERKDGNTEPFARLDFAVVDAAKAAWDEGKREGHLAVALFAIARKIRKEALCSSST